jgi:hypothetical protein
MWKMSFGFQFGESLINLFFGKICLSEKVQNSGRSCFAFRSSDSLMKDWV